MTEANNCDQNITAKKCDDNVTKYHEVLITRPVGKPFKLQEKCEDCVIGHDSYYDQGLYTTAHANNKRFMDQLCEKFKYCPECGHKIDWEKLDA